MSVIDPFNKDALEKLTADPRWADNFYSTKFTDLLNHLDDVVEYHFEANVAPTVSAEREHKPWCAKLDEECDCYWV